MKDSAVEMAKVWYNSLNDLNAGFKEVLGRLEEDRPADE